MADYRLRCRVCQREFITYKGAAETPNGRTCISCWMETNPVVPLRFGDDLMTAEVIPTAEELFPPLVDGVEGPYGAFDRLAERGDDT